MSTGFESPRSWHLPLAVRFNMKWRTSLGVCRAARPVSVCFGGCWGIRHLVLARGGAACSPASGGRAPWSRVMVPSLRRPSSTSACRPRSVAADGSNSRATPPATVPNGPGRRSAAGTAPGTPCFLDIVNSPLSRKIGRVSTNRGNSKFADPSRPFDSSRNAFSSHCRPFPSDPSFWKAGVGWPSPSRLGAPALLSSDPTRYQ